MAPVTLAFLPAPAMNLPRVATLFPSDEIGTLLLEGVRRYCRHTGRSGGFRPYFSSEEGLTRLCTETGLDGVIAFAAQSEVEARLARQGFKAINVSNSPEKTRFPRVVNDDEAAGYAAARELLRGGGPLFYLTTWPARFSQLRYQGACRACAEYGKVDCTFETLQVRSGVSGARWLGQLEREMSAWLKKRPGPLSVICESDREAWWLWSAQATRRPADALRLVLIGDPAASRFILDPHRISHVALSWVEIGERAARALWEWLETGRQPDAVHRVSPAETVVRESSEAGAREELSQRARRLWEQRAAPPPSVTELAAALKVSPSTLYRAFQRETGRSPQSLLVEWKLQRAARNLTESTLLVSDIAARCGYSDLGNFCAAFRRHFGCRPSAWRQRGPTSGD